MRAPGRGSGPLRCRLRGSKGVRVFAVRGRHHFPSALAWANQATLLQRRKIFAMPARGAAGEQRQGARQQVGHMLGSQLTPDAQITAA